MRLSHTMLTLALLMAASLWPAEEAVNGRGLHLVVLWLMLGLLHAFHCWRAPDGDSESQTAPFGLIDLGVLLIAFGHVIATLVVFQVEGDRRSALNLTFEWIGLFAAWRIFRSLCLDRFQSAQIAGSVTAIAVGLSAFGIWQHHVFYPEQAAWYRGQRTELDEALSQQDGSGWIRAREIVSQFESEQIPLEGTDRVLWENRLLSSSEPFATFALANTLAGVLATSLVLLIGQASTGRAAGQRHRGSGILILLLQTISIAYCLVLTKSRSAWAGAVVGLLILGLARSRNSAAVKVLRWGMTGAFIAGVVIGTAAFFGALDKEVILESSRSLQFRLFYWTGTLKVLREHPLAGAGPGNFRQLYLQHKADESSEEIRDPHNFVLEAWTAGGLAGLAGLLLFVGSVFRSLKAAELPQVVPERSRDPNRRSWKVVPCGLLLGFLLHGSWEWINGDSFPVDQVSKLLLLTGAVLAGLQNRLGFQPVDAVSGLAAAVAMMVNLLAAGGFEMPAVMLVLLSCCATGISGGPLSAPRRASWLAGRWRSFRIPAAMISLGMAVVVLQFGLIPVSTAGFNIQAADFALRRQRNPAAAIPGYRQAVESDPFGTTARQRLAEQETYRLAGLEEMAKMENEAVGDPENSPSRSSNPRTTIEELFPEAIAACDSLISADVRSSFAFRLRAVCLAVGGRVLKNPDMLAEAVSAQQRAAEMYPSSVENWFALATLCESDHSGRWTGLSRRAAQRALELEQINRQWGHVDRYLADEEVELLHRIVEE